MHKEPQRSSSHTGSPIKSGSSGLQAFIQESEQMLEDYTMEIQFRHKEFINALTANLQDGTLSPKQTNGIVDLDKLPLPVAPTAQASALSLPSSFTNLSLGNNNEVPTKVEEKASSDRVLTERRFKEVFDEMMLISTVKESVAGMLVPVMRELKNMSTNLADVQATVEKSACLSGVRSVTASKVASNYTRSGADSAEEITEQSRILHPWEALMQTTKRAKENLQSDKAGLARNASNMNFAGDLLGQYCDDNVEDLLLAMHKCELPNYKRKGILCAGVEPERKGCLADVIASNFFERTISLVIALNAVFITYSANYAVDHPEAPSTTLISTVEVIFQCFYIVELACKIGVHRLYFFVNKDFTWNILDTFLVVGGVYDLALTYVFTAWEDEPSASGSGNGFSLTFLRILRLLRLTKVIRIFRVMRFFSELNVLLKVITSTLRPLFWCSFMLVAFFYIFAVVFTHGTANYLAREETITRPDPNKISDLLDKFGSVWKSMISLYKASTGGDDWGNVAEPLIDCGYHYYCLFLFFIAFVILALLNILTGLFVDRAMRGVAEDKDGMAIEKLHTDRGVVADLCRVFCAMSGKDIEEDATISQEHFQSFMSSPVMRARLAVLDLEIWDSQKFYKMLTSISQTDEVDLPTFVTGCMQLRGPAKRVNLQAMHSDLHLLKQNVKGGHHFQHEFARHVLGAPSGSIDFEETGVRDESFDEDIDQTLAYSAASASSETIGGC